ncbi:MAG: ABC transporter substrate-binding protein [Nostocoides sp.]
MKTFTIGARRRTAVAVTALALAATGCSSGDSSPKSSSPDTTPSDAQSSQLDMTPQDLDVSLGAKTLIYAPVYLAQSEGYFKKQALTVNVVQVQASASIQALTGGSVDLALVASQTYIRAKLKGVDAIAIQATTAADANGFVLANKKWMDSKGVNPSSSLQDRLATLDGSTIGYTTAGAITQIHAQWLLRKAGLKPDAAKLIQVGVGNATSAAIERGDIDLGFFTPPEVQRLVADGKAEILINGLKEFSEFEDQPYSIVLATPKWLKDNPATATRFSRAIAEAIAYIQQDPKGAAAKLASTFPDVAPDQMEAAVDAMLPTFGEGGLMSKEMWDNAVNMAADTGHLDSKPDTAEGGLWTNEYNK